MSKPYRPVVAAMVYLGMMQALAGAAATPPAANNAVTFKLGTLQLTSLLDAHDSLPNDGKVFGLGVGPQAVARVLHQAGVPTDRIGLSINVLLARSAHRVMVFDTGLGPVGHGALQQRLADAGVSPAAVTDVFVTHGHGDHVGGLTTQQGQLAFANARIHIEAAEWAAMKSQASNATLVALIAPEVDTFQPGASLMPDVAAVDLPGHTPGHAGFELHSGGQKLIDVGDVVHSSIISLAMPAWQLGFDENKALGVQTRITELKRLAASWEMMFAPHFPYPGVGRIEAAGAGYRWLPARL